MIQRDYLLAIIEDFFQALAQILYKKKFGKEDVKHDIDSLYTRFLENNRAFFLTNNLGTALKAFSDPTKVSMQKELLAELLYQELITFDYSIDKRQIAESLLELYNDIEKTEQTLSLEREERKKEVQLWLENN